MMKSVLFLAGLLAAISSFQDASAIRVKRIDWKKELDITKQSREFLELPDDVKNVFLDNFAIYRFFQQGYSLEAVVPNSDQLCVLKDLYMQNEALEPIKLIIKPTTDYCDICKKTLRCELGFAEGLSRYGICQHSNIVENSVQKEAFNFCFNQAGLKAFQNSYFSQDGKNLLVIYKDGESNEEKTAVLFEDIWNEDECVIDYQSFAGQEDFDAVNAAAHLFTNSERFRDATRDCGVGGVEDVFGYSPAAWGEFDLPQEHLGTPTSLDPEEVD